MDGAPEHYVWVCGVAAVVCAGVAEVVGGAVGLAGGRGGVDGFWEAEISN